MFLRRGALCLQDHQSNFNVTGLTKSSILIRIGRFRTVTPVWIPWWQWNYTQSLTWYSIDTLLFFKAAAITYVLIYYFMSFHVKSYSGVYNLASMWTYTKVPYNKDLLLACNLFIFLCSHSDPCQILQNHVLGSSLHHEHNIALHTCKTYNTTSLSVQTTWIIFSSICIFVLTLQRSLSQFLSLFTLNPYPKLSVS